MDNNTVRVAVGLLLGLAIYHPHTCCHYGAEVDRLATHGLSCRKSEGHYFCHATLNDIMHRALSSTSVPSRMEPAGISHSDEKRLDGISLVPWERGKLLVWDVTCSDTYAPSYITSAAVKVGAVASQAEEREIKKYDHLDASLLFMPIAVETAGVFGPLTKAFFKELGDRIRSSTGEEKAYFYLSQRVSVAVQRGNAAAIMGTIGQMVLDDFSE